MNTFTEKMMIFNQRKVDKTKIWLLFLFLGWSYGSLGKMGLQILFYVTFGGFGFWALAQLFTLNGMIKRYNKKIADEIGFTDDELVKIGLK